MISRAKDIIKDIDNLVRLDEIELIISLESYNINEIQDKLEEIIEEDHKLLNKKINMLKQKDLSTDFQRLLNDIEYRISQAYLHQNEVKQSIKEQITIVLGRMVICESAAQILFEKLKVYILYLFNSTDFIRSNKNASMKLTKEIFEIGSLIDRIRGCASEINMVLEDYCHFIDLAHHLMGDKAELYGKRWKSDVYPSQLGSAIEELLLSKKPSRDSAAFLLRSLFEVLIRRLIFRRDFEDNIKFIPTPSLDIIKLLKYCRKCGISFNCSYDILKRICENLNLVIHLGVKLNPATEWYFFRIIQNVCLVIEPSIPKSDRKNFKRAKALEVLKELEKESLAERLEESHLYKKKGVNIFWRY